MALFLIGYSIVYKLQQINASLLKKFGKRRCMLIVRKSVSNKQQQLIGIVLPQKLIRRFEPAFH